MIDWDKAIETVGGKPAKVLSRDFKTKSRAADDIVVQVEDGFGSTLRIYAQDGCPLFGGPELRNKTRKVTKWSNLWRSTGGASAFIAGPLWDTEKAANEHGIQSPRWIKSVEVTWDEPE